MDKTNLKLITTYYKNEQFTNNNLDKLPPFCDAINTNSIYNNSDLNIFWSEYVLIKFIYDNLDKLEQNFIGFDQYSKMFNHKELSFLQLEPGIVYLMVIFKFKTTVYQQYCYFHKHTHMDDVIEIIDKQHGPFNKYSNYINNSDLFAAQSCFIMDKEDFKECFTFVFDVLHALDKKYDLNYDYKKYKDKFENSFVLSDYKKQTTTAQYQRRVFGYLGERLVSCWIMTNKRLNETIKTI